MGRRSLTDVSMVTAVDFDFGGITFRLLVLDGLVVLDVCSTFLICGDPAATVMVNGEDSLAAFAEVAGCSFEFTRLWFPVEFLDVLGVSDVLDVLDGLVVLDVCFTSLICGESAATVIVNGEDSLAAFAEVEGCSFEFTGFLFPGEFLDVLGVLDVLDVLGVLGVCFTSLIRGESVATVIVNGEDSLAAFAEVEGCSFEFTGFLFPGEFLDVLGVLDVLDVLGVLGVCFTSLICGESAATVMVNGKDTKLWFPNRIKGCPLTKSAQGNLPSSTHSLVFLESQI